jgi:hypothetical protein
MFQGMTKAGVSISVTYVELSARGVRLAISS